MSILKNVFVKLRYLFTFFIFIYIFNFTAFATNNQTIQVGILATRPIAISQNEWQPTIDYLQKKLPQYNIELTMFQYADFESVEKIKHFDLIFTNPEHFVLLKTKYGFSAIATIVKNNNGIPATEFGGVIFTKADNQNINSLADIKEKNIASVAEASLGGYLMQAWELKKIGINQKDYHNEFLGMPHDKTVKAVLDGKAEVGFARTGILESMAKENKINLKDLKIINNQKKNNIGQLLSTELYPEWPFASSNSLNQAVVKDFDKALFEIEPNSIAAKTANYYSFAPPLDYTKVEVLMIKFGLHPDLNNKLTLKDLYVQYQGYVATIALFLIILLLFALRDMYQAKTEIKKQKEELESLLLRFEKTSRIDSLTGLGNRKRYKEVLSLGSFNALMIVDIDRFKNYNDFYGISVGDAILRSMAQTLTLIIQRNFVHFSLFRLAGDEFGVLLKQEDLAKNSLFMQDIIKYFEDNPISVNELEFYIGITVALSSYEPFLETADMAMKRAKLAKNASHIEYSPTMNLRQTIQNNLIKLEVLKNALSLGYITPYFQPIISLRDAIGQKYESLARIVMPNEEAQSIVSYIDLLSDARLSGALLRQMLDKTLKIMENQDGEFSINLSSSDIENASTVSWVIERLQTYPHYARRLVFEILESHIIDDYGIIEGFIQQVKPYGCKIAIDDFGSGYSNFARLLNLSIDYLKIDSSLIRPLATKPSAQAVVETIVAFARAAGMKTVAEFVCDQEIYDIVVSLGVDYSQGYYTGKPIPLSF